MKKQTIKKIYSNDNDKSEGMWVYFNDGTMEFWNNIKLNNELKYRGLNFLKTQMLLKGNVIFDELDTNLNWTDDESFEGTDGMIDCLFIKTEYERIKEIYT